MASTEGIIFGDLFINNEETFINSFKEYYKKNQVNIDKTINNLSKILSQMKTQILTGEDQDKFLQAWEDFQKIVLLNNKDLELIVGYRYSDKDDFYSTGISNTEIKFSTIIDQSEATTQGKINAGHERVKQAINLSKQYETAQKVQNFLTRQSNDFIKTLYQPLDENIAKTLVEKNFDYIPSGWKAGTPANKKVNNNKIKYGITKENYTPLIGKRWGEDIYFPQYYSGQGLGQAYDAFMNHIANHHKQIYFYLTTHGNKKNLEKINQLEEIIKFHHSGVYNEEGGVGGNFPRLLYEATNKIGWFTGGDIVIVDPETMSVVYNIQLKTTSIINNRTPSAFSIAVADLKKIIKGEDTSSEDDLGILSKLSPEEKAKVLFKQFKTSISNYSEFENKLEENIQQTINTQIKSLMSQLQKDLTK